VRLVRRRHPRVHLHPRHRHPLPETHLRPAAGPHQHAKRVEVPRVAYDKLTNHRPGETSEKVRARVEAAREKQRLRFVNSGLTCNADMRPADVRVYCKLDDAGRSLMRTAMSQLQMSARGFHRVLKLARTIADAAAAEAISTSQIAEAIQYRRLDRA
jgi:magnesium chelatase family protein